MKSKEIYLFIFFSFFCCGFSIYKEPLKERSFNPSGNKERKKENTFREEKKSDIFSGTSLFDNSQPNFSGQDDSLLTAAPPDETGTPQKILPLSSSPFLLLLLSALFSFFLCRKKHVLKV